MHLSKACALALAALLGASGCTTCDNCYDYTSPVIDGGCANGACHDGYVEGSMDGSMQYLPDEMSIPADAVMTPPPVLTPPSREGATRRPSNVRASRTSAAARR